MPPTRRNTMSLNASPASVLPEATATATPPGTATRTGTASPAAAPAPHQQRLRPQQGQQQQQQTATSTVPNPSFRTSTSLSFFGLLSLHRHKSQIFPRFLTLETLNLKPVRFTELVLDVAHFPPYPSVSSLTLFPPLSPILPYPHVLARHRRILPLSMTTSQL